MSAPKWRQITWNKNGGAHNYFRKLRITCRGEFTKRLQYMPLELSVVSYANLHCQTTESGLLFYLIHLIIDYQEKRFVLWKFLLECYYPTRSPRSVPLICNTLFVYLPIGFNILIPVIFKIPLRYLLNKYWKCYIISQLHFYSRH